MSINRYSKVSCIIYLFFVSVVAELIPVIRDVRYILIPILALPIIVYLFLNKKSVMKTQFSSPVVYMICLCIFLIVISIFMMAYKNVWNTAFIREALFMFLPILLAWVFLANSEYKDCRFIIDCFFYFTIITFLIRYWDVLSIDGILSVSFSESYSLYESELVNIFLPLSFYYMFIDRRIVKALISILLCWLSMKRIHEIFLILYIIIFFFTFISPRFKKWLYLKNFSKFFEIVLIVIICLFPIILVSALSTDILNSFMIENFGISLNAFMLGRENMYKVILSNMDSIAGWGGTRDISFSLFGTNDMHSDILRIYLETSIVGLIAFVTVFIKLMKRRWILLLYMGYVIAVMLVSPIITDTVGFVCIYIVLFATLTKYKNKVYSKKTINTRALIQPASC